MLCGPLLFAQTLVVRDPSRLAFVTQTTLSVDDTARIVLALQQRFPELVAPKREDICYATQNRQDAVKQLVERCEVVIVVGSRSSSNSNRLREIAEKRGIRGYLVDGAEDLDQPGPGDRVLDEHVLDRVNGVLGAAGRAARAAIRSASAAVARWRCR